MHRRLDMNNSINVKKIKQKVYRESDQDGIIEIWMGIFFLFYAAFIDNFARGIKISPAMLIFMILMAGYPILYLKMIRNTFTYPRMGYVNLKEEITPVYTFTVILPLILLPLFIYIAVRFLRSSLDISLILRWMSVVFGLVFGALFFNLAQKYGKNIYFALMAFSLLGGIILAVITWREPGVTILLVIISLFFLIHGIFMLVRFIRKYPKPKPEITNAKKAK